MNLDLSFTESEEMLRKAAQDFMQRDAPKDVVQALQETSSSCRCKRGFSKIEGKKLHNRLSQFGSSSSLC